MQQLSPRNLDKRKVAVCGEVFRMGWAWWTVIFSLKIHTLVDLEPELGHNWI